MTNDAAKELERIERELDTKASEGKPTAKPPSKSGVNAGTPPDRPAKHFHLDAVIVGAVLLAAISIITMLGESLSPKQRTQLTAASMGGAAGLLIGYCVGRIQP